PHSKTIGASHVVGAARRIGKARVVAHLESRPLVGERRTAIEGVAYTDKKRDRLDGRPCPVDVPCRIRLHRVVERRISHLEWIVLVVVTRLVVIYDPGAPGSAGPVQTQVVLQAKNRRPACTARVPRVYSHILREWAALLLLVFISCYVRAIEAEPEDSVVRGPEAVVRADVYAVRIDITEVHRRIGDITAVGAWTLRSIN